MGNIIDLVNQLAPEGVKYQSLGSLGRRNKGTSITAGRMKALKEDGGPIRIFAGGQTIADVAEGSVPERDIIRLPSIVVKSRGHIGFTYYDKPFTHKSELWSYSIDRDDVDQRFVYHYLLTKVGALQAIAAANSVKMPQLIVKDTDNLQVPVPPIEVQKEVVRRLDLLQGLEAELEAQLVAEQDARRAQYDHYRNNLLAGKSAGDVRWVPLGQLADFKYGFTASAAPSGDYRFLRITDITPGGKLSPEGAKYVPDSVAAREYLVEPGDLLMARTGGTYGKTMLVSSSEPAVYASFLIRIRFKQQNVLPAYYWHFAQSTLYWDQANAMVSTGGQPQFNANVLKLVELPLPPIPEQERIVALLDRFDAVAHDLALSLPAERTARRVQYEYYRERLLTFQEAVA